MKIYRGIFDVSPSSINPTHEGGGYFGCGTYYSFDESLALEYCLDFSQYGIVYEAEINSNNDLLLDTSKIEGLSSRYGSDDLIFDEILGTVNKEDISDKAKSLGYDTVSFIGNMTGGSQMLVLNPNTNIVIISYQIIINSSNPLFKTDLDWTEHKGFYISRKLTLEESRSFESLF